MDSKIQNFSEIDKVGDIVARSPGLSRVFEEAQIDYCCGGKKPLKEACQEKGIDAASILSRLEDVYAAKEAATEVDVSKISLAELVDHIQQTHHVYLRSELPRLDAMTEKVASVHGKKDVRLQEVRDNYCALAAELSNHMMKEEQVLFPMVRQLDKSARTPKFHCGSAGNPIRQMEHEHDQAGEAIKHLRELTDGYVPPEWACNTYRALLDGLSQLERDLHLHIHKENNVLFPRTIEMEENKRQ